MITITVLYGLPYCIVNIDRFVSFHCSVLPLCITGLFVMLQWYFVFSTFFSILNYFMNDMVGIKSRDPQNTQLVLNVLIIEVKGNENLLL